MVYTKKLKHLKDFTFEENGESFRLFPRGSSYQLLPNKYYYIMYNNRGMIIDYVKVSTTIKKLNNFPSR